ncbi:MAG: radical SAM family heme chaperone HemW [Gemmatimonadales bacterium]|nr:radical SAM family heme chaperone HemW [Gemmatimonadales bacterium]
MHLYLHVPFCARRCSYCDFAIAVRRMVPSDRYADAVLREWALRQDHPGWALTSHVETAYFGGGTPSRLNPSAITRILDRIASLRPIARDAEITLEANPEDVSPVAAGAWRRAGVNRVSLGVQSFDPTVLSWMHRTHTVEQVPRAVATLRDAGVTDLSLDLIFGLPAALGRRWDEDLEAALALQPTHLSLYGLTVEAGTPLARWTERGEVTPVDEERYAAEFLLADAELTRAGYRHYEVSNYARDGARARHNGAYWRRAPFLGLGPSAHSGWGCDRQWNLREWTAYETAMREGLDPIGGGETLDDTEVALEELYLGLRTADGVSAELVDRGSRESWIGSGWALEQGGRVCLTPEGWLRLDALVGSVRDAGRTPGSRADAWSLAASVFEQQDRVSR